MFAIDPYSAVTPADSGSRGPSTRPLGDAFGAVMARTESARNQARPDESSPSRANDAGDTSADDRSKREDDDAGLLSASPLDTRPPAAEAGKGGGPAALSRSAVGPRHSGPVPPELGGHADLSIAGPGTPTAASTITAEEGSTQVFQPGGGQVGEEQLHAMPGPGARNGTQDAGAAISAGKSAGHLLETKPPSDPAAVPAALTSSEAINAGMPVAAASPPNISSAMTAGESVKHNPAIDEPSSGGADQADLMSARQQGTEAAVSGLLQVAPGKSSPDRPVATLLRAADHPPAGQNPDQSRAQILIDGDTTHVRLHSRELGAVAMTLQREDHALSVHVHADRSESGEIMRRHADILDRELRNGNSGTNRLSFSDGPGSDGESGSGQRALPHQVIATAAENDAHAHHDAAPTGAILVHFVNRRLNVRL